MKKRLGIISLTFACLIGTSSILNAMSYAVNKNFRGYNLIYASGHIKRGDLYNLKREYNKLPHNKQTIVVFNSSGGELNEGLKIGRFLKQNGIGTYVRNNGICASSCAMAFLGGRSKSGSKLMILPSNALLGYHSFYYKNGNYVRLNRVQKDISGVLNYASYVGAPNYLMAKMFDTDSKRMYFINNQDRRALGIKRGLKIKSYNRRYASADNINVVNRDSAENYIKKYLKSYNNLIASNSGNFYSSDNIALNSNGYKSWLSKNLRYIHLEHIRERSYNNVEAKVIYSLRNGKRICSINRYNLQKTYNRGWIITSKQHIACSTKNRRLLRKISKALP